MSSPPSMACGVCERTIAKATRVEAGVRYCSTCYSRSFKRLMCGGCGMFKRLLASRDDPRCQSCVASMPCIRCRRSGRPIGKMSPQGPACNSCYRYFTEPRPCEICSAQSRSLSSIQTASGERKACARCRQADRHTCTRCRRHRPCLPTSDGKWQCRLCTDVGEVTCSTCSMPMPAGGGKRCQACYWLERFKRSALQLAELFTTARARDAFAEFATWLSSQGSVQRPGLRLAKHAEFFETLDGAGDEAWTGEFLLRSFGTATLRRYGLPVRWLQETKGVSLSEEEKTRQADGRRARDAVAAIPPGTVARDLLEKFSAELKRRCDVGALTERSMRLAIRPAVALLMVEDPQGVRAPGQAGLERYLASTPGQRAAVSTFVGFLRSNYGIELRLPAKRAAASAEVRNSLERQITSLMSAPLDARRVAKHWLPLALRFFHHLSAADAKAVCLGATRQPDAGGTALTFCGQTFWVPAEPSTGFPSQESL